MWLSFQKLILCKWPLKMYVWLPTEERLKHLVWKQLLQKLLLMSIGCKSIKWALFYVQRGMVTVSHEYQGNVIVTWLSSLYKRGWETVGKMGGKNHKGKNFNDNLICRAGRNRPQFEAVMESFLGQAPEHFGTIR